MTKELKTVKANAIKPYDRNPRHNDSAVEAVKESIKQCEYIAPIIVDEDNVILAGHTRYKALKELGVKEIEIMQVTGLSDEQKRKYRLLDNKTNELATWDIDLLEVELEDIDFDGFDFGFDIEQIEPEPEVEEDDYTEENVETRCKLGDLWQLGDHRLICGDSTDVGVVDKLMDGQRARMLFTSPPYSDMREYNGNKDLSVSNIVQFIPAYRPYTDYQCINLGIQRKDNDVYEYWNEYIATARECGYKMLAWNVWDKGLTGNIGQASAMFPLRHEWVFVFGTQFFEINLTQEKKPESITDNPSRRTKRNKDGTTSYHTTGDTSKPLKQMESVLFMHPVLDNKIRNLHPAQFPIGLPAEYIKSMTDAGDNVIEPFGGAGTTLMACEQLNRNCFICELDEHYCDVIIDRWEQYTGNKAVLVNE